MSLMESGHSTGEASLSALMAGDNVTAKDPHLTVPDIIDRMCIGGSQALLDADSRDASRWLRDYLSQIVLVDIQEAKCTGGAIPRTSVGYSPRWHEHSGTRPGSRPWPRMWVGPKAR